MSIQNLQEIAVNLVSEGTRIEGKITFDFVSRVHGILIGEIKAKEGSTLILGETSVTEGSIEADTLIIDGYVQGNITAKSKIMISRTGRVIGNIQSPSVIVEFGAFFEGQCYSTRTNLSESPKTL